MVYAFDAAIQKKFGDIVQEEGQRVLCALNKEDICLSFDIDVHYIFKKHTLPSSPA